MCHKRLLIKLDHYDIRGIALELTSSYLTNRSQFVCINNVNSECKPVLMGIPHGSMLGPLLFLIYINDLQNSMESTPRLFADDTAILIDANSTSELEIKLNVDLARVFIWMNKNQITPNPLSSHALVIPPLLNEEHRTINFSLNPCTIKNSECIKYLGVSIDFRVLGLIFRCFNRFYKIQ